MAVYPAMECTKLKLGDLCEQQSWHLPQVKALASWTDCTKNRRQWTLTCSGLQIAKQLDSREGIVAVIVMYVADFVLCFLTSHTPLKRQRVN